MSRSINRIQRVSAFRFDHTYTPDQNHQFLKKLGQQGFSIHDRTTKHPGGSVCRFIAFTFNHKNRRQYLEFVHKDKGHKPYKCPGLSLAANEKLEKYFEKVKHNKHLKLNFSHRNYEWKKNTKDHLPGWNFLKFKNSPKNIQFWITEYEPTRLVKKREPTIKHQNGAFRIAAIDIDVNPKAETFFRKLFGLKTLGTVELSCGTILHFNRSKKTREKAVVLEVHGLDTINQQKHAFELTAFQGEPALRIKNPSKRSWDILMVDSDVR